MARFRAVLFDVDGVLLDSDEALVQSFAHTFRKFGFPSPSRERILSQAGKTGVQWIRALLPAHSRNMAGRMQDYHAGLYAQRFLPRLARTMPGARESLLELRSAGVRTAVISNMWRWVLDSALRRFRLEGLFDAVISSEDVATPKPAGLPLRVALRSLGVPAEEALFVGDTGVDVLAGRHAGVKVALLGHKRNNGVKGAWRRLGSLRELPLLAAGD